MLKRSCVALVIAAFFLTGAATAAETKDPLAKFLPEDQAYLNSADYLAFLKGQFVKYEPAVRLGDCQSFAPDKRVTVTLADHLLRRVLPDGKTPLIRQEEFASNAYSKAMTGAWVEQWDASMCGKTVRRGLVVFKTAEGQLSASPTVPGNTLADMRLQIDTLKIGLPAFLLPRCEVKNYAVLDTQVLDASKLLLHSWTEKWTITQCGQTASRIVEYGPAFDGGTNIVVSSRDPDAAPAGNP